MGGSESDALGYLFNITRDEDKGHCQSNEVIDGSKTKLWEIAKEYGGGLTRKELRDYFNGVSKGHALVLSEIRQIKESLPLNEAIPGMRAPQSYVYLTNEQFESIQAMAL